MTGSSRYSHFMLLLLSVATTSLVLFPAIFLPGYCRGGPAQDLWTYEYPMRDFAFTHLRQGIWPLWNPYVYNGTPFQTGIHPLLYPGNLIGLLLPTWLELKVFAWFHMCLGFFCMAALLRHLNFSLLAAYLAGAVFILSGHPLTILFKGHLGQVATLAYFPLVFLAVLVALKRAGFGWTILAACAIALMLLIGRYQTSYLVLSSLCLFTVSVVLLGANAAVPPWKIRSPWSRASLHRDATPTAQPMAFLASARVPWRQRMGDLARWATRMGTIAGLAGMLCAIQLLPTSQSIEFSDRGAAQGYGFASSFGAPLENWLTYLVPRFFGGGSEGLDFWLFRSFAPLQITVVGLVLAFVAIAARSRREWLPHVLAILWFSLLAMGTQTPVLEAYYQLDPIVGQFRAPLRFVLCVAFFGAWLAALGLESLRSASASHPRLRALLLISLVVTLLSALAVWLLTTGTGSESSWAQFVHGGVSGSHGRTRQTFSAQSLGVMLRHARSETLINLCLGLAATGAAFFALYGKKRHAWLSASIVFLLLCEIIAFAWPYLSLRNDVSFEVSKTAIEFLQQNIAHQRVVMYEDVALSPNYAAAHGIANVGGYDVLLSTDYRKAFQLATGGTLRSDLTYFSGLGLGPLWDIQGARYYLKRSALKRSALERSAGPGFAAGVPAHLQRVASRGGVDIFENPGAPPRAFLVYDLHRAKSEEDALETFTHRADLVRDHAIVHGEQYAAMLAELTSLRQHQPGSRDAGSEKVTIVEFTPNSVAINVEAPMAAVLVLTDAPWPGWHARIDDEPTRIWSANAGLHRTIILPAGSHEVRFDYWPQRLTWGLSMSGATLLLIVGYLAMCTRPAHRLVEN